MFPGKNFYFFFCFFLYLEKMADLSNKCNSFFQAGDRSLTSVSKSWTCLMFVFDLITMFFVFFRLLLMKLLTAGQETWSLIEHGNIFGNVTVINFTNSKLLNENKLIVILLLELIMVVLCCFITTSDNKSKHDNIVVLYVLIKCSMVFVQAVILAFLILTI